MIPLPESVVSQSSIASSWMTTDPKASINTIPVLGAPADFAPNLIQRKDLRFLSKTILTHGSEEELL